MDISSVNSDLIRGNVTTIILGCLKNEDKYGYEILKEIEDKSHSQYALKQATLYNQLKRLEKQGLVASYDGAPDDTGGGKRRYYALTPEGRNYLTKEKGEYEYARTILDKLVSEQEFDFTKEIPFDASELRPYSKRGEGEDKPKIVYKDKIVEVEKTVEIEKKIYIDRFGNPITEEEFEQASRQALIEDEQARKTEKELASTLEKLRTVEEEHSATEEQLRLLEEDRIAYEEQLRASEEERKTKEEELRASEEQRAAIKEELRLLQEQRREEEELRRQEEERRRAAQTKPSTSVEELFEKLEAQSEYMRKQSEEPAQEPATKETDEVFVESVMAQPPQSTLEELFKKLDERGAEIEEESARRQEEIDAQAAIAAADNLAAQQRYVEAEIDSKNSDNPYVTSAVLAHNEDGFEYEKTNVNYRDFFASIVDYPEIKQPEQEQNNAQQQYSDADIKTRLYAKGFKIRPYDKGNTSEYYTFNFIQSNRINRDTFLIILAFFLAEMAVMWVSLATRISYLYFLPITVVCSALCLVPTVMYFANPTKRIRANFNFKLSILNRLMLFIELTVVCVLIGFFALGASVNDIDLIFMSMIIPAVILLNLPISSIIYWLLYRTRKYHIA